jgi:hypothetical protein
VAFDGPINLNVTLTPGGSSSVPTAVATKWTNYNTTPPTIYALGFVSITGGTYGGITVFPDSSGLTPLSVSVPIPNIPNPQIAVNAYYFPESGGGTCPAGKVCATEAFIDEFGETQGALLDDSFVSVYLPQNTTPDSILTTSGNVYGVVDTTNSAVRINADKTTPTGGSFEKWFPGSAGTIGSATNDLNVKRQTDDYALAYYRSPCPAGSYWNPSATINQCSPIPNCGANAGWDATTNTCVPFTGKCPSTCKNGCNPPRIGPQGQTIWTCQPSECHSCPAGQTCTVWGVECNCLSCKPSI